MTVGAALAPAAPAQQQSGQQEIGLLFAQTANRGTMKPIKGTPRFNLKLRGVNPQVVWFSDRPARQSGHIPVPEFTRSWAGFGFVDDPPNAALTLLRAADHQDTVVVELGRPHFKKKKNRIRYSAQLLDEATGNLSHLESDRDARVPRRFRAPSLFIDDAAGSVIGGCLIQPHTQCPGVDLSEADLRGADLSAAYLPEAVLTQANLFRADLSGTDLTRANLSSAVLEFANLRGAVLTQAKLFRANLSGAILTGAFAPAEFQDANLSGAEAVGAILRSARFDRALLTNANLRRSVLEFANLQHADLRFADLSKANLHVAGFVGADLRRADLTDANLRAAVLTDANLSNAKLTGARFCQTRMPDGSTNNKDC